MPKQIRLLTLKLSNYRNIQNGEFHFEGKSGQIAGLNRVGKTNILEAICWLLTDKLTGNSANIPAIKPLDDTTKHVSVEGEFSIEGETGTVTIKKEFYEHWIRPHGAKDSIMDGHTTDYYINGAKQSKAKDFFASLEEKFGVDQDCRDIDVYQLLMDPFYFAEIACGGTEWKKGRSFLISLVGDVSNEEVYKKCPACECARSDLERHQYNDGEAKKELKGLIDGASQQVTNKDAVIANLKATEKPDPSLVATAKAKVEEINNTISKLNSGDSTAYDKQISDLAIAISNRKTDYTKSIKVVVADHTKSDALAEKLRAKQSEVDSASESLRKKQYELSGLNDQMTSLEAKRDEDKKALEKIQGQIESYKPQTVCPACGQPLPEEKINAAKDAYLNGLNAKGDELYNGLLENKAKREELQKKIDSYTIEEDKKVLEKLNGELEVLKVDHYTAQREENESVPAPVGDKSIQADIDKMQADLNDLQSKRADAQNDIGVKIQEARNSLIPYQQLIDKQTVYDAAMNNADSVAKDKEKIEKNQSDYEQRQFGIGLFVKTKLELLDEHIAKVFGALKIQLVKPNIKSDSYDEVCVPFIFDFAEGKSKTVLWPEGSKSEQIRTGCAFIKAIREAKGWPTFPILFDQGGEMDSNSLSALEASDIGAQFLSAKVDNSFRVPTFLGA